MKATEEWTNGKIAKILRSVAAADTILGENRFKIAAYENAATAVEHAGTELKDLWDEGKLDTIPGLGPSLVSHLDELFKKGKSAHFETILKKVSPAVFPLLDVPGLGAKKANKLVKALELKEAETVIADLEKAAREHKIAPIPNFGEKSEADILDGLEHYKKGAVKEERMVLPEADWLAGEVIQYLGGKLGSKVVRIDKLGSLRRQVATVGDIDIAAAAKYPQEVIDAFVDCPKAVKVVEKGSSGATILLSSGRQIDLRVAPPEEYGAMLQYFTGSKQHNIKLRELALKKGFSLSEHGIKPVGENQKSKIKNQNYNPKLKIFQFPQEEGFYNFLELDHIPPELREDQGEIEAALLRQPADQGKLPGLPKLVELSDIRGDLHLHSSFGQGTSHDSGLDSMRVMGEMGEVRGYEYIGISDHNPSSSNHTSAQIVTELERRRRYCEELNSSTKSVRVINLLEVDIAPDGSLPVSDKGLALLDAVLVGVHSVFRMDRAKMTNRIIKGLSHPKAKILAHPTGRLLEKREGYELDWDKIFGFCLAHDKALEINAEPARLDLPDFLVREAVKRGVKISLGTDAHNKDGLAMMKYGVSVARRGWTEAKDIINTWSCDKIIRWFKVK